MTEQERFIELWEIIKRKEGFDKDAPLLRSLGYKSRTAISEIKSGRPISDKLLDLLSNQYGANKQYVKFGEGDMFVYKDTNTNTEKPTNTEKTGDSIRAQKAFGSSKKLGITYVPLAAQAGYTRQYMDPTFLHQLERIYMPGLPYIGDNFRIFDVEGDSMFPTLEDKMQVIAEFVEQEHWKDIRNFYIHVVVTVNRILIKRLYRLDEQNIVLISDNEELYPQELVKVDEIKELWEVKRKLDWNMMPPKRFTISVRPKN